jgi:hypothetical protein
MRIPERSLGASQPGSLPNGFLQISHKFDSEDLASWEYQYRDFPFLPVLDVAKAFIQAGLTAFSEFFQVEPLS